MEKMFKPNNNIIGIFENWLLKKECQKLVLSTLRLIWHH